MFVKIYLQQNRLPFLVVAMYTDAKKGFRPELIKHTFLLIRLSVLQIL